VKQFTFEGELERVPIEPNHALSVMPAHSASKTRVNALMGVGIQVFAPSSEDVDGREKPGHDCHCRERPQTLTFSSSTTRLTAGRASMRSLKAV
jgi:hypothetical protein